MRMSYPIVAAVFTAMLLPTTGFAQSSGSLEFEETYDISAKAEEEGVGGRVSPDATKAKEVIDNKLLRKQTSGQTVLNSLNLVPAVNFTNADPYGSSGGQIRIRGFDGARISLTFDGFPLNDSGNYAIYPNQMLDPELIRSASVNLGATDVDSPTASATGGTVNYLSLTPAEKLSGEANMSFGEYARFRVFGLVHTGAFTSFGTKAWLSASMARNDKFKGPGEIFKQQYNGKIYQPISDNDYVSLAFHYNQNRNNFYLNPRVADMQTFLNRGGVTVIPAATNISSDTPLDLGVLTNAHYDTLNRVEWLDTCTRTTGGALRQDDNGGLLPNGTTPLPQGAFPSGSLNPLNTSSCSSYYGLRINPSNTGNLRLNSKFSLPSNFTLTADGVFQYVLANGGGFGPINENDPFVKGTPTTNAGVDFNGDGDFDDRIGFYRPSNTNTHRYSLMTSLIWDGLVGHRLRLAYTFDLADHRQTGEYGLLKSDGTPENVFSGRNGTPVLAADGAVLQNRDRHSVALLNQISAQYVGYLFEDNLRAEVGLRVPFFARDLNQYCYTNTANGSPYCSSEPIGTLQIVPPTQTSGFPSGTSYYAPFTAKYNFSALLPNVGLRYKIIPELSAFASYAQGFSAPRTDNLYSRPLVTVEPEKTNSVDVGLRLQMPKVTAQMAGWFIGYSNRIVTSFDQLLGIAIDRNVGSVDTFGIDASAGTKPVDFATLLVFGSYTRGELKNDIQISGSVVAPTAGKRIVETPEWMLGGRTEFEVGPASLGAQGKWVSSRFATDVNDVIVPGYAVFDLDARINFANFLKNWGFEDTWVQFNVTNLFNTRYLAGIGTQTHHGRIGNVNGSSPSFSIGAPRAITGSIHVGF